MHLKDEKYCLINVGRIAGKVKFCMLDENKSWIGELYHLRAILIKDSADRGEIHVLACPKNNKENSPEILPIQNVIWANEQAENASLRTVYHINGNTMDNRVSNLSADVSASLRQQDDSVLYWKCLEQLVYQHIWMNVPDCLDNLSNAINKEMESDSDSFDLLSINQAKEINECHYLPCTRLERKQLHFGSCSLCRCVRYCSAECQQLDWPVHRLHCEFISLSFSYPPSAMGDISSPQSCQNSAFRTESHSSHVFIHHSEHKQTLRKRSLSKSLELES